MRRRINEYDEFYSLLQSGPPEELVSIVQRVRSGSDVSSVLRGIKGRDLPSQLSTEPDVRHRGGPPSVSALPPSLRVPGNTYLESHIYRATVEDASTTGWSPAQDAMPPVGYEASYFAPFRMAELVHPRLAQVQASPWTTVISDDRLLMRLLNIYFLYEHVNHPAFHMDHFLDDMASGSEQFCSPLLVNAVLGTACVS